MRLGQTSVIYFAFSLLASIIGFTATLYIARQIGAAPLGIYHLALSLITLFALVGEIGISGAISKRVSEGRDRSKYAVAGILLIGLLFILVAVGVLLFRTRINDYVGYPAAAFVVLILFLSLVYSAVSSLLTGLHLVHVDGALSTVQTGGRSLFQITAVFAGLGVTGLFWGHIGGFVVAILIGLYVVFRRLPPIAIPRKHHFRSLFDFAKFSWLGNLESRMFNYTDIVVLGFFVSSSFIGIYSVAWNVAQFLSLFSGSLTSTMFPEMSKLSAEHDSQAVSDIVEQSLVYGALFLIPGVFGGAILGERILRLYGPEFTQGAVVLSVLIVANLFRGYQKQLLNALNAIDRPKISFRVNAVFIAVNLGANVILISLYGWLGAAVATAASIAVSLAIAYYYLSNIVVFSFPVIEIARQWIAAILMAVAVYAALVVENTHGLIGHNFAVVVGLVTFGAGLYFAVLLVLSARFRTTVRENLPVLKPYLSW
jgi:O-antigen/teichoic acid export membrane protein